MLGQEVPGPANNSQSLADTCPGQNSQFSQPSQPQLGPWGYLFPEKPNIAKLCLTDNEYLIGRAPVCNFILSEGIEPAVRCQLSKQHFKIRRDELMVVYITDISSNGTYVNGAKIGRGKSKVLKNNDTIALATSSFVVFTFMEDKPDIEFRSFPITVMKKYALSRKLGSGAYGEVRIAYEKETGHSFAMKIIAKSRSMGKAVNPPIRVQREIEILKKISNKFVIKFHDVLDHPDRVFLVMELMRGGDLFSIVQKKALKEPQAKNYFYQLSLAVQHLHSQGIVHRDIKLENILLSSDGEVIKLADFGLSNFVDSESMLKTMCGTPLYIAPEVVANENSTGYYDAKADVWSMGVVLYICLSATTPFVMGDKKALTKQILKGFYSFPQKYWTYISHNAKHLIRRILVVNPAQRITIDGILEHQWLKEKVKVAVAKNMTEKENLVTEDEDVVRPNKRAKIN